jgi:hypothetical protein
MTIEASINHDQNLFELRKNTLAYWAFHLFSHFLIEKSKNLFKKPKPTIRLFPTLHLKFIHGALPIG